MRYRVVAVALTLLMLLPIVPPIGYAKEFELDGIIDCGQPSGKLCLPLGPTIGIITDQYSGKKNERVEVGIGLILEQKLKKTKNGEFLLHDTQGIYRARLFAQIKPLLDQLAALDPPSLSPEDKERLVDQLFDQSLPRDVASARDKLMLVASNFAQESRIRVIVSDGPVLMATEIQEYQDYSLPQSRSSGTQNHGQLTGDDSELGICTDFVEEFLDFAKKRIQDRGKFELTNNEEFFFELFSELPNPCNNKQALRVIGDTVGEWITWNLKAAVDELQEPLQELRRERTEKLRSFLERPGARLLLLAILKETILKPQPKGRAPFRNIVEERTR